MLSLGPRFPLTFWLWLLPTCLSASNVGKGQSAASNICSSPLVFAQSFVLSAGQAVPQSFLQKSYLSLSLFFFSSLAIPQFGLLSHVNSLRMSSGHLGPVPTLCMQPPLAAGGCKWPGYLSTGSCGLVHNLWVLFFSPPSYVALRDSETPHRRTGERVSWCLETSPPSQLPPQDGSLSLTLLSLFLSFIFCPTSFQREWAAFLGASCPPPAFRSCFVEFAQH